MKRSKKKKKLVKKITQLKIRPNKTLILQLLLLIIIIIRGVTNSMK